MVELVSDAQRISSAILPEEAAADLERVVERTRVRGRHFSRKPDSASGTRCIHTPAGGQSNPGFKADRRNSKASDRSSPILDNDMPAARLLEVSIRRIVRNEQQRHHLWRVAESPSAPADEGHRGVHAEKQMIPIRRDA